jgi:hypothetical protein
MKKYLLSLFLSICISSNLSAQIYQKGFHENLINPQLFSGLWKAQWITSPEATNGYEVIHFRKSFDLPSVPTSFIIHISADNRYKLYVNGQFAGLGPARGDVYNWNFVTKNIAPLLKTGKNTIAVMVWNYGPYNPAGQMSLGLTGLVVQGNGEKEAIINTDKSWKCFVDMAYTPITNIHVNGYYVAGATEKLNVSTFPWGWESADYNDSTWKNACFSQNASMKGGVDVPGRELVPQPIPEMEMTSERLKSIRSIEGMEVSKDFKMVFDNPLNIEIPAYKKVRILLDNEKLTTAYMNLLFSKGKDAKIAIGYTESLYDNGGKKINGVMPSKGNRNEIEGKTLVAYWDSICPDGSANRQFQSLWWRTYRYVALDIETAAEPLEINDIYGIFTAYPFKMTSSFKADNREDLQKIIETGWQTARLCANETYMDCPYYEQLQYFGDTRIQTMVSLYNTSDTCMVKHALEAGRHSMTSNGIPMSRYPSAVIQFIPPYSLSWIGMVYDYWMYRGDDAYVKTLLPVIRTIISWYEQYLKEDGSLAKTPFWNFADWAKEFHRGEARTDASGHSAFRDLELLYALQESQQMEEALGMKSMAKNDDEMGKKISSSFKNKYWNDQKKLFADTEDRNLFSQHVNILAILTHIVEGEEAKQLFEKMEQDTTLAKATIYFSYYLNEAREIAGLGDEYLSHLDIWNNQMKLGLSTWAEAPEPARSDCHAWGASPNVELLRMVLGVKSGAPGFKTILISPHLKGLKTVSGTITHPNGEIGLKYVYGRSLKAEITLPQGTTGVFLWHGKQYPLKSGMQTLKIKDD